MKRQEIVSYLEERAQEISDANPRTAIVGVLTHHFKYTTTEIGRMLGKCHSTIHHHQKKHYTMLKRPEYLYLFNNLTNQAKEVLV